MPIVVRRQRGDTKAAIAEPVQYLKNVPYPYRPMIRYFTMRARPTIVPKEGAGQILKSRKEIIIISDFLPFSKVLWTFLFSIFRTPFLPLNSYILTLALKRSFISHPSVLILFVFGLLRFGDLRLSSLKSSSEGWVMRFAHSRP